MWEQHSSTYPLSFCMVFKRGKLKKAHASAHRWRRKRVAKEEQLLILEQVTRAASTDPAIFFDWETIWWRGTDWLILLANPLGLSISQKPIWARFNLCSGSAKIPQVGPTCSAGCSKAHTVAERADLTCRQIVQVDRCRKKSFHLSMKIEGFCL